MIPLPAGAAAESTCAKALKHHAQAKAVAASPKGQSSLMVASHLKEHTEF
jgi:hypothetical protein